MTPTVLWRANREREEGKGKRQGNGEDAAKKSAKKSVPRTKKPADMVQVRENINNLVRASAEEIATGSDQSREDRTTGVGEVFV